MPNAPNQPTAMPDATAFRRLALALAGTTEQAHFARAAFRARIIFASLAPDGQSANLRLTPDQQQHWCALMPDALAPVPSAWGARGWTTITLARLAPEDLAILLRQAWQGANGPA